MGFTVKVKDTGVPVHVFPPLVKTGVTVIVAETDALPVFMAVNGAMVPVPLAASPMDGFVLVQLY